MTSAVATTLELIQSASLDPLCTLATLASVSPELPSPPTTTVAPVAASPNNTDPTLPTSAMVEVSKIAKKDCTEVVPATPLMPSGVQPPLAVINHLIEVIRLVDKVQYIEAAKIICHEVINPLLIDGSSACLPALLLLKSMFISKPNIRPQFADASYALDIRITWCLRSSFVVNSWFLGLESMRPSLKESPGFMFLAGLWSEFVKKNLNDAAEAYNVAALKGCEMAYYQIADLYSNPLYSKTDLDTADNLYKKAAKLGNASAFFRLGVTRCESSTVGVTKKRKEGAVYLRKAISMGHHGAQRLLACELIENAAVNEEVPEAIAMLKILAKKGCGRCARILYNLYIQGHHVNQDLYQAIQWQHLALLNGDPVLGNQIQQQQPTKTTK